MVRFTVTLIVDVFSGCFLSNNVKYNGPYSRFWAGWEEFSRNEPPMAISGRLVVVFYFGLVEFLADGTMSMAFFFFFFAVVRVHRTSKRRIIDTYTRDRTRNSLFLSLSRSRERVRRVRICPSTAAPKSSVEP